MKQPVENQEILILNESDNEVHSFGEEPVKRLLSEEETFYVYENDDGTNSFVRVAKGRLPPRWPRSSARPIKVDRLPEPFETWDRDNDCWIKDDPSKIDFELGKEHKDKSHTIKSFEARLIKLGMIDPCFILVKEAEATGQSLQELADLVLSKEQPFQEQEILRRTIKKGE